MVWPLVDIYVMDSITFVAGRTRAQIVEEMEQFLGFSAEGQPNGAVPTPVGPGNERWESELARAISEIGKIAQDRASKLKKE